METYILSKDPVIEISILEDSFKLKGSNNTLKNGNYEFSEIDSLRIEERVNWLVSIFSFIFELVSNAGGGDFYRERNQLKFNYKKKSINISLKDGNLDLALEVIDKINMRVQANK